MANYSSVTLYVLYSFNESEGKVKDVEKKINQDNKYSILDTLGKKYSDSTSIKSLPPLYQMTGL